MRRLFLPHGVDTARLRTALAACEKISAKDKSNLYVTSQFFEDRARYDAFIAMYAVMRLVDDLVDNVQDKGSAPKSVITGLKKELDRWEQRIRDAYRDKPSKDSVDIGLAAAAKTFPVPIQVWLNFIEAMRFDVDHPRFEDFQQFLEYGEGATVAPTVIYVYLLTAQKDGDGVYRVHDFDFVSCGRDLGLFAYLAHILRDVKEDMAVGETGLVYLSRQDLKEHGLDEKDLRAQLKSGVGDDRWRALVKTLAARARVMEERGAAMAQARYPMMDKDCAFILCLIITVYNELLRRIDLNPDLVLRGDPMMGSQDRAVLAAAVARMTNYPLPRVMEKMGLTILMPKNPQRSVKADAVRRELLPDQDPALLQELHLLTRDGHLNADALRKLKQVNHLVNLLTPALEEVLGKVEDPIIVDVGSGNAYLGFILYDLFLKNALKGRVLNVEGRPELTQRAQERASRLGFTRMGFETAHIVDGKYPEHIHLLTALHACDTATDDAIAVALKHGADHVALIPCCQAEVAAQLKERRAAVPPELEALFSHAWHRREFGSHLTNVIRALTLEAHGYSVTVTELTGWEHSLKNELILARKVQPRNGMAQKKLDVLLKATGVTPKLTRELALSAPSSSLPS